MALGKGLGIPFTTIRGTVTPTLNWILATGFWNDDADWNDDANWID